MASNSPKYQVGDVVVVIIYGTVGTITSVYQVNQQFLYEVNHGEVLFFERAIVPYKDYEGNVFEIERVEIEYNFAIGDLVNIKGYGKDLFKIAGLRTEVWRYLEDGWEDTVYELTRVTDGEWLEAAEEELELVMSQQEAEKCLQQIMMLYSSKQSSPEWDKLLAGALPEIKKGVEESRTKMINHLLDIYNDYVVLYHMFQDREYQEMMDLVLESLKRYTSEEDENSGED
ncbi:hypothetical protein LRR81_04555 [Metabacillus sp. GX 13764]|uniref:hypothetical protein n=1 Tax=Metabacillus kandeliae TaxID=2900151 RepID=UPI001E50B2F9|nr:hypothetical protein [Metabacillus kandeliae]MCD7033492.1 hypothetical protein [Metabacillus kandeliae]